MLRLLRQQRVHWLLLLGLGEAVLLILSVLIAVRLRYIDGGAYGGLWGQLLRAALFTVAILLGMSSMGLHQSWMRERWFGTLARQAVGFLIGWAYLALLYFFLPGLRIGLSVMPLALLVGFASVAGFRALILRVADFGELKRRVLVLGAGDHAARLPRRMRRAADRRNFRVLGYQPRPGEAVAEEARPLLPGDVPLSQLVREHSIDEVVVAPDERRGGLPMSELLACRRRGVIISELSTFFEREGGEVPLDLVEPSWLVYSSGFDLSPLRRLSKRGFDLLAAGAVLLLAWPLILGAALAIRIESGRGQPILYRQRRVGKDGRCFDLLKFRSMRTDAEHDGVARWAREGDDRITRVGRVIRRLRIDELPQLWNIIRGDMSLIGPRPERPEFVAGLEETIRYYSLRHCVRPGLAGWAQLRYPYGASAEDAAEKLKFDLFYVKNHSLLLDALILIGTLEVVLFGRGVR